MGKRYCIEVNALTEKFFEFDTKKELEKYLKFQKKKRWEIAKLLGSQWVVAVNRKQPKQWKMLGLAGSQTPLKQWFRTYYAEENRFI